MKAGFSVVMIGVCILLVGASLSAGAQTAGPGALADELVRNFRDLVLLHESASGKLSRERAAVGQQLFFRNRQLATRLADSAHADAASCIALMDHLQSAAQWRNIDRLALGGVMAELDRRLVPDSPCLARIKVERGALASVRALYNRELSSALGAGGVATGAARPEWADYVAFIKRRVAAERDDKRGAAIDAAAAPVPAAEIAGRMPLAQSGEQEEWTHGGLPHKSILLTFDDGPHPVYTPRVLDILARFRIKAVFFQIGQNIETALGNAAHAPRASPLIKRILAEGHSIANHSYSHPLLPKLGELAVSEEMDRTEALLSVAAGEHPGRARLFRPPYGARNDLVLADISLRGLRSVIWNIDSRDWADPIPQSIVRRVVDEALDEGRGIVLFHDIHLRSVDALQPTIEELIKRGFRFARLAEGRLVIDEQ